MGAGLLNAGVLSAAEARALLLGDGMGQNVAPSNLRFRGGST
ncbi:hypothetical protein Q0M94_06145 [Deinococcus radiomollis]